MIFGGEALRSITDTRSSDTIRSGFCGSILVAAVTSTKLSSGAIQIDVGAPTTLVGALTVAITFGGYWPTSMIDTVSGGGFLAGPTTPSTFALCASFAVTARSAKAAGTKANDAAIAATPITQRFGGNMLCVLPRHQPVSRLLGMLAGGWRGDRKSTRLNSSHLV